MNSEASNSFEFRTKALHPWFLGATLGLTAVAATLLPQNDGYTDSPKPPHHMRQNFAVASNLFCLPPLSVPILAAPPAPKTTPVLDATPTIVLDPGHGEWVPDKKLYDSGAIYPRYGRVKYMEKDLNMLLAQAVKAELVQRGYQVVMTHTDVNFIGKGNRHDTLTSLGATDLDSAAAFISIHQNEREGSEILYNGASTISEKFAKTIGSAVTVQARPDVRDLAVLKDRIHIRSDDSQEPAILFEAGNMSSQRDRNRILNPNQREKLAARFADAVIKSLPPATPQMATVQAALQLSAPTKPRVTFTIPDPACAS